MLAPDGLLMADWSLEIAINMMDHRGMVGLLLHLLGGIQLLSERGIAVCLHESAIGGHSLVVERSPFIAQSRQAP